MLGSHQERQKEQKEDFIYTSQLDEVDQKIMTAISHQFHSLFVAFNSQDWNDDLIRYHFDQYVDAIVEACNPSDRNGMRVIALVLVHRFFKITRLSGRLGRKNKAAELISAASKCADVFGYSIPGGHKFDEKTVASYLCLGEFKPILEHLSNLPHTQNSQLNKKIIELLKERELFHIEYLNDSSSSQLPESLFKSQRHKASQLLADLDEGMDQSIVDSYRCILNILAGDFAYLMDKEEDFIQRIKGYIMFVDPFLNDNDRHAFDLLLKCNDCKDNLSARIIVMTLSSSFRSEEIIELVKKQFPQYIYHSLQLFACYLDPIYRKSWSEEFILGEFLAFCASLHIDFFTSKPFANRQMKLHSGKLDPSRKAILADICFQTFNNTRNKSGPLVYRDCQNIISSWLSGNGMDDVASQVKDQVFDILSAQGHSKDALEPLMGMIMDESSVTSLLKLEKFFNIRLPNTVLQSMLLHDYDRMRRDQLQVMFSEIKTHLPELVAKKGGRQSPALTFLEEFVRLQGMLVHENSGTSSRRREAGQLLAALAKEFCHVPGIYKVVFITLIVFRTCFEATVDQVDELISTNLNMSQRVRLLRLLPSSMSEGENASLLDECVRRCEILLLQMRANASFL